MCQSLILCETGEIRLSIWLTEDHINSLFCSHIDFIEEKWKTDDIQWIVFCGKYELSSVPKLHTTEAYRGYVHKELPILDLGTRQASDQYCTSVTLPLRRASRILWKHGWCPTAGLDVVAKTTLLPLQGIEAQFIHSQPFHNMISVISGLYVYLADCYISLFNRERWAYRILQLSEEFS